MNDDFTEWVESMSVADGRGYQEAGVGSGWNLWLWLECIGVGSGCCCKEVIDILIIIITFPFSTCISSFLGSSTVSSAVLKYIPI